MMANEKLCAIFEVSEENQRRLEELIILASQQNFSEVNNSYFSLFFSSLPESSPYSEQFSPNQWILDDEVVREIAPLHEQDPIQDDSCQFVNQSHKTHEIFCENKEVLQNSGANDLLFKFPEHDCDIQLSTLTKELKDNAESLKGHLQHCHNLDLKDVVFLSKVHPSQMKEITSLLNFQCIAEESFLHFCKSLAELALDFSHASCVNLLSESLLPRMQNATQSSRIMKETVAVLANKFPRPLLEILKITCASHQFNMLQCDLVIDAVKSHFQEQHRAVFFRELINIDKDLNENFISVLQSIMEKKISIDEKIMDVFIGKMHKANCIFSKHKKFSKLLHTIIRNYGHQLSELQKLEVQNIVASNGTFLKTVCEKLLN